MTAFYVANCRKQDFLFTYMFVENPRPFHHKIRAGSQLQLNLDQGEVEQIIKQHSIYGMQPADKVTKRVFRAGISNRQTDFG